MAAPSGFVREHGADRAAGLAVWVDSTRIRWFGFEGVWKRIFFDALQYALKAVPVHSWWLGQTTSSGLFIKEPHVVRHGGF